MADTRTPDEIERDIERERAELGRTVDELQNRISPERILREIGRGLTDHGQEFGEAVTRSVKRNPVALALTGIGLAWLMSGKSWEESRDAVMPRGSNGYAPLPASQRRDSSYAGRSYDAPAGTASYDRPAGDYSGDYAGHGGGYGGSASGARTSGFGESPQTSFRYKNSEPDEDWLYADDDDYWDLDDYDDDDSFGDRVSDAGSRAADKASHAADKAGQKAGELRDNAQSAAAGARDRVAHGAASVRDGVASAGQSAAERARRIRRRLSHGLENLGEEARERVVAARWRAVKARRAAARRARQGSDAMARFYDENPLVVGGLALAAGAILAGTLPRTRQEDAYLGKYSDRAYDKAERIFQEERRKAMKVADRAAQTAQEVLEEERAKIDDSAPGNKSAAEHVADEARGAAKKVADATKDEAEKQKLGNPSS